MFMLDPYKFAVSQSYIEDYFSAYTYTGNGGTQSIVNGVDLATKGGLVWCKARGGALGHLFADTVRGARYYLQSNNNAAQQDGVASEVTAFNADGFSLGASGSFSNPNATTLVGWSFAQGNKFFKVATATVAGGVSATVDLSSLGTVGFVVVKRTDSTSAWFALHRSNTSGKICYLNTTAAETTDASISLSGTTLTLTGGTIANGTYIVYAWAHDSSAGGLIQCGSFTTDGSGNASLQSLGWEPQFIITKKTNGVSNWYISDTSRGMNAVGVYNNVLAAESSSAESTPGNSEYPAATGFSAAVYSASSTYIYLAIRRGPMKQPTVGTQVFNAIARTGTGAAATVTGVGFPPDLVLQKTRVNVQTAMLTDRLRGATEELGSAQTNAEAAYANDLTAFGMDGLTLGSGVGGYLNTSTATEIYECFRRYPGVFDEVCYTGTGANATPAHNLTVAPELWIVKQRTAASTTDWIVGSTQLANTEKLILDGTNAKATDATAWNSAYPTSTALSLGTLAGVNVNNGTFVAWLFATLAGISKVGSYTGNGTSQTINCGFAAGARFILIKRTDNTGDWFVWDSVRGIVAGNDPHLSLNTTAAEVTTDDTIDPDNSGFVVNQVAATNVNVNSATYIYLALA